MQPCGTAAAICLYLYVTGERYALMIDLLIDS